MDRQGNMIKQPPSLIRGGQGEEVERTEGLLRCSPLGIRKEEGCTGTVNYLCFSCSRQVHLNRQIHLSLSLSLTEAEMGAVQLKRLW